MNSDRLWICKLLKKKRRGADKWFSVRKKHPVRHKKNEAKRNDDKVEQMVNGVVDL